MYITELLQNITAYIDTAVGGNEFASGILLGGLMGSATYLARIIPATIWSFTKKHTTTSMDLNSTHESFHYLMRYFFKHGLSDISRTIKMGNGKWGEGKPTKEVGYGKHWFWYKGWPIQIELTKEAGPSASSQVKEFATITKIGRSHILFNEIIANIKETTKKQDMTVYYMGGDHKEWICEQPKRFLTSIILSKANRVKLTNHLTRFTSTEQWFLKHGIPYQLGILLYGPPGTGKTSLIRAIAAELNKDIITVTDVASLVTSSQRFSDSIIVAEEIDTFGLSKRSEETPSNKTLEKNECLDDYATYQSAYGKFSLGKILNALDGVISNHGRIIILTSNKRDVLDSALLRPGRIDLQLEIGYFTIEMFAEFLARFFTDITPIRRSIKPKLAAATLQQDIILGLTKEEMIDKYTYKE